jgi:uncharacterized membrane protein
MLVNLTKRLKLWREHDIISEENLRRITEFESSRASRSWVSFGIAGVGVTAFIVGVISIIAANWEYFGDAVKLSAYFILLVGVGVVFLRHEHEKGLAREISLTLFTLLVWAGIGLFAQIYNLSGTWWQAMLFWTCITAPAVTRSNSRLLCSLWCLIAVATSGVWSAESEVFGRDDGVTSVVSTTAILLTAAGIGAHSVRLISETLKTCSIVCGIGFLLAVATPAADAQWDVGFLRGQGFVSNFSRLAMLWCATALAVFVSMIRPDVDRRVRRATSLLFIVTAAYLSGALVISPRLMHHGWPRELCGAVGFIIVWSVAASAAALASMRRLFELASFVIAVRFVVIYFQVFGTLSTTGIGLIISGIVIIGIALLWNRGRRSITSKLGGHL